MRAVQGFARIALAPGEQKTVSLPLDERRMSLVSQDSARRLVPGMVEVWIGGGQPPEIAALPKPNGSRTQFRITGSAVLPN